MSQVLRLSGLEEGGLFTNAALKEYNGLPTNLAKRSYLVRLVRSGYALDQMGLSPIIELLQTTDGKRFLKMSEQERLQRLRTLINALLGESTDAPAVAQPAASTAPAAPVSAVKAEAEQAASKEAEPPAQEEKAATSEPAQPVQSSSSESNAPLDEDQPHVWGGPEMLAASRKKGTKLLNGGNKG